MTKRYAGIAFRCSRRIYCFEVGALHLDRGDEVVVETDRGINMGVVVIPPEQMEPPEGMPPENIKKVLRQARDEDFAKRRENEEREAEAQRICREKIEFYRLQMKLVQAEYMHDGSRVIFYFTAENRVDFRELVKDLAHTLRVRVEMRQIGIRDAAGMIGGIGICGRELCCATFLTSFEPVTVKMAKEQNLALNPMKISGICGRLMCCLGYEYEDYRRVEGGRRRPRRKGRPARSGTPAATAGDGREKRSDPAAREDGSGAKREPATVLPAVPDPSSPVTTDGDADSAAAPTGGENNSATRKSRSGRGAGRSGRSRRGGRNREKRKKE